MVKLLVVAGCGGQFTASGPNPDDAPPLAGPDSPNSAVTTAYPVTVLDDGDGAELCLGGVAESLPPQCGGPKLIGWDWSEHEGQFEEVSGVRWGGFKVTGTFDGTNITVTDAIAASAWQGRAPAHRLDLSTPCPEPEGGWRVVDPALTTSESMKRVFEVAAELEGYAGAWMDQSINPAYGSDDAERVETRMNNAGLVIINVRVTGDVERAEAKLRQVWGGMLCVSSAERTEAELRAIQNELTGIPGHLSSGVHMTTGTVRLEVVYDDGTLQTRLDQEYGAGVVRVSSALIPAHKSR